jgi:transcriptional regulator with XRE-family HTH domain
VSPNEANKAELPLVVDRQNHSIFIPADIEYHPGSLEDARKTLAEKAGVSESTIKRFEATGLVTLEALILIATALDELDAVTKLFKPEHPGSLDELKNARRKRGMR